MADSSDICNILVQTITQTLFNGSYTQGAIANSTLGYLCQVSRGWPLPEDLDNNLSSSITTISVIPVPGMTRDTTRYNGSPQTTVSTVPVTLQANAAGTVLTLSGTATAGQVIGLTMLGEGYAYRLTAADTPTSVAQHLQALIPASSVLGASLSLPTDLYTCQVVSDGTMIVETRRQSAIFNIGIWTYDPNVRDRISSTIDQAIAGIRAFILPDGSQSEIPKNAGSYESDRSERADLWRRDLRYSIEYPTTSTQSSIPGALFGSPGFAVTWPVISANA